MDGSSEASSLLETVGKSSAGALAADALELEAQYLEQHNEMPLGLLKRYIAYCRRFADACSSPSAGKIGLRAFAVRQLSSLCAGRAGRVCRLRCASV